MALSINPLSKIVSAVTEQVAAASSSVNNSLSSESFSAVKADLNEKISAASGALNSGLGSLGGIGNDISSAAGGALKGLNTAVQSVAGAAGDISNAAADIGQTIDKLGLSAGGLGSGLRNLAGQISSAAGALNNILSLGRARNLPSGAELFKQRGAFVEVTPGPVDDWRVRLNCNFGLFGDGAFQRLSSTNGLVWPFLPNVSVSTKANYNQIDPVHNNQPFYAYKNSQVEDITIAGEFTCETATDAEYWIEATTFLKTATKMWFGTGENVGNPPVICNLSGYGSRVFNNVPVIVKSFTVNLTPDVNYIKCMKNGSPTWVPVLSEISVTVAPIYNRTRLRQFSLKDYANGNALGYI